MGENNKMFGAILNDLLAKEILKNGKYVSNGCFVKDCFWAGYEYNNKCYLFLNNQCDISYEVDKETMLNHCDDNYFEGE
jgi:hypothetical protein